MAQKVTTSLTLHSKIKLDHESHLDLFDLYPSISARTAPATITSSEGSEHKISSSASSPLGLDQSVWFPPPGDWGVPPNFVKKFRHFSTLLCLGFSGHREQLLVRLMLTRSSPSFPCIDPLLAVQCSSVVTPVPGSCRSVCSGLGLTHKLSSMVICGSGAPAHPRRAVPACALPRTGLLCSTGLTTTSRPLAQVYRL